MLHPAPVSLPAGRWALGAGLPLLLGCPGTEQAFLSTESVPAEVAWLAILPARSEGPSGGTGLLDASEVHPEVLAGQAQSERVWILGYRRDQLPDLPAETLRSTPLHLARGDDPTLPEPHWHRRAELRGDHYELSETPAAPAVTASWQSCPLQSTELAVNVRCQTCGDRVLVSPVGCALDLDLRACQFGRDAVRVRSDSSRSLTLEAQENPGCTPLSTEPPSLLGFECTTDGVGPCRFDVLPRTNMLAEDFVVHSTRLVSLPMPPLDAADRLLPAGSGYVTDLALLTDRVVAAVLPAQPDGWYCDDPQPGRLDMLDPDTLQLVASSTVEPCLTSLAAEPEGTHFFGAFGRDSARLGRFDAAGRVVAELDLAPFVSFSRSRAVELAIPDPVHLDVLVSRSLELDPSGERPAVWLRFDRQTLELQARLVFPTFHRGLRYAPDGQVYLLDPLTERVVRIEGEDSRTELDYRFRCEQIANRVADFLPRAQGGFLFAARHSFAYFFALGGAAEPPCPRDAPFEVLADPSALIQTRDGRTLGIVVARDSERSSYLLELDSARVRVQPGLIPLGRGQARFRGLDEGGRLFGVGPAEGRVFRIDPR